MRTACSILNVLVWLAVWLQCPVSAIPYVVYDGHAWATLDAADPQASGYSGCQNYWLALPEGWEVAPASNAVRTNVIGAYGWGTDVLVAANGEAYSTATAVRHGWSPGTYYRSGWLEQNSNEYKTSCWGRILIYQALWGMGARKKVECKGYSPVSTKSDHASHSNHACPSLPFLTIGNHVIS